jgi:CspA family cold shock protein
LQGYAELIILCIFVDYLLTNITITMEGTVKFFNEAKGFGFVKEQGTEKEYFVHVSGLVDKIRENDKITFELKEGKKGLNAVNVRVAQ